MSDLQINELQINEEWYKNEKGQYHKTDGPAIIRTSGTRLWIINGYRHREDGPAIEYPNGDLSYYLDSKCYLEKDWEIERLKWLDHRGFPMSANKVYRHEEY